MGIFGMRKTQFNDLTIKFITTSMKHLFLLLILISTTITLVGKPHQLKSKGKEANIIPKEWTMICETKGDFNNDGYKDWAFVAMSDDSTANMEECIGKMKCWSPTLAIYFGTKRGKLKQFACWDTIMSSEEYASIEHNISIDTNEENYLKLGCSTWHGTGTWKVPYVSYTFRFQDNKFQLIERDVQEFDRATQTTEYWHYNYITGENTYQIDYGEYDPNKPEDDDEEEDDDERGETDKNKENVEKPKLLILGEFELW